MEHKILVIEDVEFDWKLIKLHFNEAGFKEMIWEQTGEKGIESAKRNNPDFVLIDTKLPQMNGFETCQKIKNIAGLKTKVVIMTGFVDAVDVTRAREAGSDDYCVKTIGSDLLIETINKLIENKVTNNSN